VEEVKVLGGIEKSIEIKASPERVWEMLALDKLSEWMDVLEMKSGKYISEVRTSKEKYKVGATAHIVEKRWEYDLEIMESLENEKITVHSKGKYPYTITCILKPVDNGTRLTYTSYYESKGFLSKAFVKLFAGTLEKQVERALEKLKSILEK
jgi:carbon monoxide dehydrogenase subunit G